MSHQRHLRLTLLLGLLACSGRPEVLDLDGQSVDPLAGTAPATVLLFTRSDCPISNRYAPEVRRIVTQFAPQGATFWLVYADPDESPDAIRAHMTDYSYDLPVARDMQHELVRRTGVRVTPEAVVFDGSGKQMYRGRIDNRYEDFDVKRNAATRHDLQAALAAVLAGKTPETATTKAVGCYIEDLQ